MKKFMTLFTICALFCLAINIHIFAADMPAQPMTNVVHAESACATCIVRTTCSAAPIGSSQTLKFLCSANGVSETVSRVAIRAKLQQLKNDEWRTLKIFSKTDHTYRADLIASEKVRAGYTYRISAAISTYCGERAETQVITSNEVKILYPWQKNNATTDAAVSAPMSREAIMRYCMQKERLSYEDAKKLFPVSDAQASNYRILSVTLPVTKSYQPHLEFLCSTNEAGDDWEILSLCKTIFVTSDQDTNKEFCGEVNAWLRGTSQIEYMINGDFFSDQIIQTGTLIASQYYYKHDIQAF